MVTIYKDTAVESGTCVERQAFPGMVVSRIHQGSLQEIFISAWAMEGEGHKDVFKRVARVISDNNATVVCQQVFGFNASSGGFLALQEMMGEVSWPVTWLEGSPVSPCSGMEIWAVKSACVEPIQLNGVVLGCVFDNGESRICRLGGLLPPDLTASPTDQTRAIFDLMEQGLSTIGMDFSHVVRTWFHHKTLLSWYGDFNRQRTRFFDKKGVFRGLVPASTGVSGINPLGAALTAGLLAIHTPNSNVKVEALPSPLQCPALDYGSSFSRAVVVQYQGHQRVFISGTASIDPDGQIAFHGDLAGQIQLTLDVVHSILDLRDLSWPDVVRAIAYVKHPDQVEVSKRILAEAGLMDFPLVYTQTDLCYGDLLFEMEIDAIGAVNASDA